MHGRGRYRGAVLLPRSVIESHRQGQGHGDRQHTQLAGTTANRPAAPLVRDEKAWTMRTKRGPAPIDSRSVQLDLLTTCSLWSREPTGTRGLAWNAAS